MRPLFEIFAIQIVVCFDSEQPDFHPIATLLKRSELSFGTPPSPPNSSQRTSRAKCIVLATSQKVKIVKNSSPILMKYKTSQFLARFFESVEIAANIYCLM